MKKFNASCFTAALGFLAFVLPLSSAHAQTAVDRCDGLVPTKLIQAERIADLYFDMRLAELQCHYVEKDQTVLNKIGSTIDAFEHRYAPCIKSSQDQMVADLGSENTFTNFYAKLGNQIVLLNVADPCARALKISTAMMKKQMSCGAQMANAYTPYFDAIDKAYIEKEKQPLHRICDKTDS